MPTRVGRSITCTLAIGALMCAVGLPARATPALASGAARTTAGDTVGRTAGDTAGDTVGDTTGGRFAFEPPALWSETDTSPAQPSVALPSGRLLNIVVSGAAFAGQAFVEPCGAVPPVAPARFLFRAGERQANTVITGAGAICFTASTPVHVRVETRATISSGPQAGQLRYVAVDPPESIDVRGGQAVSGDVAISSGAVPADALGVVIGVSAIALDAPGAVTFAASCPASGSSTPDVPTHGEVTGEVAAVPLASPGAASICLNSSAPAIVQVTVTGYLRPSGPDPAALPPTLRFTYESIRGPGLHAIEPLRVLDTREAIGVATAGKLRAGGVLRLDLLPHISAGSTAAVLNVTVTDPDAAGHVTVYPCDEPQPTTSNLNYVAGQTVPNLVTVRLAVDGSVCLYTKSAAHLVADVTGTYEFGGGDGATSMAPVRLLDTRQGVGTSAAGKVPAGETLTLAVGGRGGIPASGASAVSLNVTVTDPAAIGFVTVYPCDAPARPTASNLNYVAGQTVANAVTVRLSPSGTVCLYTKTAAHLVADVSAWFGPEQHDGYEEVTPARVLDTREPIGVADAGQVAPRTPLAVAIAGRGGVPSSSASAVTLNVTVVDPASDGFATVYPCDTPVPTASNVNYTAGMTVPNQVTVRLSASGTVCIYTQSRAHVLADVAGYFTADASAGWVAEIV